MELLLFFGHGKHACSALATIHTTHAVLKERYLDIYFNAAWRLSRTYAMSVLLA
jgi:hypothetical protein